MPVAAETPEMADGDLLRFFGLVSCFYLLCFIKLFSDGFLATDGGISNRSSFLSAALLSTSGTV